MNKKSNSSWAWVPTLYFAEGLPYVLVMTVSVIMYKNLGIANSDIAFYTSWLYLPWVIKPFWSPFVDLLKTKRWWVCTMQLLIGVGLAGIAFTIPTNYFFQTTLAFFWLLAFSSATHDIAADGFYMLALKENEQSLFVGIRNTFYRIATVTGEGLLVMLAGYLSTKINSAVYAWSLTFMLSAGVFLALFVYHYFLLPKPKIDEQHSFQNIGKLFVSFFKKKNIIVSFLFLLLYRFGEAQLAKIAAPFLLDPTEVGGLGLSTESVGFIKGTIGVVALLAGGILGGVVVARNGLKTWLLPMALMMNLPNLVYVYFAYAQPQSLWLIASGVAFEQFGYGFGFTAFTLYLIFMSKGEFQTAHYAIGTGIMALGMMLPGMFAGQLQEAWGYAPFFIWVCLCTIPGFLLLKFLKIDNDFGKK